MDISLFDYDLPDELIAQRPSEVRDGSRLLVLGRDNGIISHEHFFDIESHIREGDVLVMNDSKVIHARLIGTKQSTGARIEVFLVRKAGAGDRSEAASSNAIAGAGLPSSAGSPAHGGEIWEALVRPSKRVREGDTVVFADELRAELVGSTGDGGRLVSFECRGEFSETVERLGRTPLPPYIRREADESDDERYQTVYSKNLGSVAAPTAGLHFTDRLLDRIRARGAETVFVTLHVGLGTFKPVKAENIEEHRMHTEEYHIPAQAADAVNRAKAEGRRVICVGTTSVRTLESAAKPCEQGRVCGNGFAPDAGQGGGYRVSAGQGDTDIFIYPGYEFKLADAIITNFHLPKSTLLMLVSAFAGRERVLAAYEKAVRERYRFFSYGDAMLIV
ncbi:MAG: tRNA preQ1(34) S-adenosylmethionine ribosyltransferase-isomerase QueA [Clostridiales Family XIII bacterium]|nr:tRNA preQ1(34) S-adenosylmethionine ribosyltransferase-isomerase QueA [Clostridiales Family XIII bacterium]